MGILPLTIFFLSEYRWRIIALILKKNAAIFQISFRETLVKAKAVRSQFESETPIGDKQMKIGLKEMEKKD